MLGARKENHEEEKHYQEKKSLFSQIEPMLQFPYMHYILKSK